ncbi:MAG TPA: type II secretion system protein [Candidatus Omnitrophota bacterium]|nr:type II secretion system protein [Candidatus Omnitrophota bacterium]
MIKRGFTLIELVIVITILGILAILIAPHFLDLRGQAELSVAKHFGGALKEAHNIYYMRLVLENPPNLDPVAISASFYTFVDFSGGGQSDRNTISVDNSIRALLQDPGDYVSQPDGSLLLNFKSGARATYYISPTGAITEEYTGF